MKIFIVFAIMAGFSSLNGLRVDASPLFGYTHVQPSPLTLPAGRLQYGTEFAFGVTDFLQIGTNVVSDIFRFYNANAKLSLIDYPEFALTPTLQFSTYNLHDINDSNPDKRVIAWLPGLVGAYEIDPALAVFVGANLNFTRPEPVTEGIVKSGYYHGAELGADLSWAYNPATEQKKKKNAGVGNVASTGVTYDFTYKIFGIGLSHHWRGFHLGVHYYPNADRNQLLPIVAGGGVVDF